jgi:hypothetical protein
MLFSGCGDIETNYSEEDLFVEVDFMIPEQGMGIHVLVHKETRVMYIVQYRGGMVVMLNPDGTPMLWEGELKGE